MAIKKKVGDDTENDAVERHAARLDNAREEPEDDDEELVVGGGDDDDEDPDEAGERVGLLGRREKRAARGRNMVSAERERAERAEAAAEEARREAAETRALLNRQLVQQQPQRTEPEVDPEHARLDQEYDALEDQRQALVDRYEQLKANKQLTQADLTEMQKKDRELRRRAMDNRVLRNAPRQQAGGPTAAQLAAFNNQQRLFQDHGDVVGHEVAQHYFTAEMRRLNAGKQADVININWDNVGKAAARARELAGLPPKGGRPAPSKGQQAKFGGVARGSSGSGGGEAPSTMKMTPELKALAKERYPYIKDEKKRNQKFVNEHAHLPSFRKQA